MVSFSIGAIYDYSSPSLATPSAYLQARERVTREVFLRSPAKGTAVMADAYYTEASGGAMVSIEHRFSRSDTVDAAYYRYSKDYGRAWGPPIPRNTGEKRPEGMLRRHPRTCIVEPKTGRFIEFWIEGILPTDNPLEGNAAVEYLLQARWPGSPGDP